MQGTTVVQQLRTFLLGLVDGDSDASSIRAVVSLPVPIATDPVSVCSID